MAFPDIEKLVIDYLKPIITPVSIGTRVPDPLPDKHVQIRRFGGTNLLVRDTGRLDVFSWALTEVDAFTLATQVRTALHDLKGTNTLGIACYEVNEFLGLRHDDDSQTGRPRYWFSVDLVVRANL